MADHSELNKKLFIDREYFNCPFCNEKNVMYVNRGNIRFDWDNDKECFGFLTECTACTKISFHLSWEDLINRREVFSLTTYRSFYRFLPNIDIDSKLFYSQPA